jgi:hypothetical protein
MSPYLEQRNKRLSNHINMNTINTNLANDYALNEQQHYLERLKEQNLYLGVFCKNMNAHIDNIEIFQVFPNSFKKKAGKLPSFKPGHLHSTSF